MPRMHLTKECHVKYKDKRFMRRKKEVDVVGFRRKRAAGEAPVRKLGRLPFPRPHVPTLPPIAPSVSAHGCPGLDEFHPFPSTPTFPLLFPEPTTPGPIPHPARLPPATTTKSKSLFLAPRTVVHTAPHRYSRLSRASASLPWPLHVIPSADTKIEIHPSTISPRTKRPTEPRLIRVSCRNWARLERPHISTAVI